MLKPDVQCCNFSSRKYVKRDMKVAMKITMKKIMKIEWPSRNVPKRQKNCKCGKKNENWPFCYEIDCLRKLVFSKIRNIFRFFFFVQFNWCFETVCEISLFLRYTIVKFFNFSHEYMIDTLTILILVITYASHSSFFLVFIFLFLSYLRHGWWGSGS
jgi:hypothetical protein